MAYGMGEYDQNPPKKVLRNSSTPKFVMADPKKRGVCSPECTRAKSGSVMRLYAYRQYRQ
jgi:hypothetical protein